MLVTFGRTQRCIIRNESLIIVVFCFVPSPYAIRQSMGFMMKGMTFVLVIYALSNICAHCQIVASTNVASIVTCVFIDTKHMALLKNNIEVILFLEKILSV